MMTFNEYLQRMGKLSRQQREENVRYHRNLHSLLDFYYKKKGELFNEYQEKARTIDLQHNEQKQAEKQLYKERMEKLEATKQRLAYEFHQQSQQTAIEPERKGGKK